MKSRRGLSSVIGVAFFVMIFSTAISYVAYDTDLLNSFSNAIVAKNQVDSDTNHEQFSVTKVTVNNNKFNITVQNSGNIPINITRLWVQNKTDVTWGIAKYIINSGIVYPGHSLSNIGQNLVLTAKSTQGYDLKLVTSRGNTKEFFVNSASQSPVYLQLFALPASGGPNNFNTTLLFAVTNNMTNGGALSNIQPNMTVTKPVGTNAILISGPSPSVYPLLQNGDVAYFQWIYKITGTSGQTIKFSPSLKNGYLNNFVSQNVTLTNSSTASNIGHGGKGVFSSLLGSTIQLRNITSANANHLTVNANVTDISIDTGSTLTETSEASTVPLVGGTSTVPGISLRWYQFYTMPATEKYYLITGIEWINKATVAGNVQCGVDRVNAIPPTLNPVQLLAYSSLVAQSGTSGIQRNSQIVSTPIKAGTLVGAWCESDSSTATFGTTPVTSANNRKTIAFTAAVPTQDNTAWTASATGFSVKLYYVGYK